MINLTKSFVISIFFSSIFLYANASVEYLMLVDDIIVDENASTFAIQINATDITGEGSTSTISFDYEITNITTTSSDYNISSSTGNRSIVMTGTQAATTIDIPIVDDIINENDETFNIRIYNFTNDIYAAFENSENNATVTIEDNDNAEYIMEVNDITVDENTSNAIFTVRISNTNGATSFNDNILFDYNITNITTSLNDFNETNTVFPGQTIEVSIGNLEKNITVPINNDNLYENDETFRINIYNFTSSYGTFTTTKENAIGTIIDDDAEILFPSFDLNISSLNLNERNITKIEFIDENGTIIELTGAINNGNFILSAELNNEHNYTLKFTLSESISTMWYNFSDNKLYENDNKNSTDFLISPENNSTYSANFEASNNDNWVVKNYEPTINMIYDRYLLKDFGEIDLIIKVNDNNHDTLNFSLTAEPQGILNISNTEGNITYSHYNTNDYNININSNGKIGKVKLTLSVSDANSTISKSFNIIVQNTYLKYHTKTENLSEYDSSSAISIDFNNTKLYSLNDNIYNNYNVGTNRYIVNLHDFNDTDEGILSSQIVIDLNGTVNEYENKNKYFKSQNNIISVYSDSLFTDKLYEFKYIKQYNSSELSELSNISSFAYEILEKYSQESLYMYDDVKYNNEIYSDLSEFKIKFSVTSNTMGLMRNYNDTSKMLFFDNNTDGNLIEVNDKGKYVLQEDGTYNAGTWEEKSINLFKYKDSNNIWHNGNVTTELLIIKPTIEGYNKNTAFAVVGDDKNLKIGQYYAQNEIVKKLYYNNDAMKEIYSTFSQNPKINKTLNNGWTYISIPTTMTLCDQSIKNDSILLSICNSTYSLNDIFSSSEIKYVLKNLDSDWSYWDNNSTVNSHYGINKFLALNNKDGIFIKTNSSIDIKLPYDIFNNEKVSSLNIDTLGWRLIALNTSKTMTELKSMIEENGKKLKYVLVFRNNEWVIHSPTNDSEINSDIKRLIKINKYESFWINTIDNDDAEQ